MCITMALTTDQRSLLELPDLCPETDSSISAGGSSISTRLVIDPMPPLVPCDQQAKRATSKRSSKEPKRAYIHNYHDHLGDPLYEQPMESTYNNRGGVQVTFPEKLFMMLDDAEEQDFASIVSWQPHGRCFVVHKPREFVEMVLPNHFNQTKLTSFQRQLALYGFARLTQGPDKGGYYHELFLRGRSDLHKSMVRSRVKGTGHKKAASPETEPVFSRYEVACEENAKRAMKEQQQQETAVAPPSPKVTASSVPFSSGIVSPEASLCSTPKALALPPCPILPARQITAETVPVTPCASITMVHSPSESSFSSTYTESTVGSSCMTNNDEDSYQSWSSSHLEIRTYREEPANTGTGSYFYCKKEREPATEEDFTAIMQAFADDLGDIGPMDAVDQEIAELMTDPIFLL